MIKNPLGGGWIPPPLDWIGLTLKRSRGEGSANPPSSRFFGLKTLDQLRNAFAQLFLDNENIFRKLKGKNLIFRMAYSFICVKPMMKGFRANESVNSI